MFGKGIKILKLFGFEVRIDASWLILALLVTWSLASSLFPSMVEGLNSSTYWLMGVIGAVGLFASIVIHELLHSLVARAQGMRMNSITLFIFGGVADMRQEPADPKTEFSMAIAGPLASVGIAALAGVLAFAGRMYKWPDPVIVVFQWLSAINLILVVFNMIPAFPLDGGRVLRSSLWKWKNDLTWATRVTSQIGAGFGMFLILMGVFSLIGGSYIQGIWLALIGLFLRSAAQSSYRQMLIRNTLKGEPVSEFMQRDVHAVPPQTSVREFLEDYVYAYNHKMFPVKDNDKVVGCVTTNQVKQIPRAQWDSQPIGEVASPCTSQHITNPDADAMRTFLEMARNHRSRLLVMKNEQLVGMLTMKDLMQYLSLRLDVEQDVQVQGGIG